MSFTKRGRVHGSSILFPDPLPLPEGAEVAVHIETLPAGSRASTVEVKDLTSLPFFGMWADRQDMADATAWVEGERQRWTRRIIRQD